ncbi:MAG: tetratricopeptide repeat protein [bacterium]|nr:tetratricopeptide repeat protein [bacterium]
MKSSLFIIMVVLLISSGCGLKQIRESSDASRANTQLLLEKQAEQIAADQARDSVIAELQQRIAEQDLELRGFRASATNRFDSMEQLLSKLASRVQETTGKFGDVAMGISEVRRKLTSDSVNTDTVSARAAIDAAESDLARGNYELAVAGFGTFLERWANSPLAVNAYFGRGQAKLALKDTSGAIADYRAAGSSNPPGERTPSALWQMGRIFHKQANYGGAKTVLGELMKSFPETPEANRAKELLDKIKVEERKSRRR